MDKPVYNFSEALKNYSIINLDIQDVFNVSIWTIGGINKMTDCWIDNICLENLYHEFAKW